MAKLKICILGAGSIGCYLGAYLQNSGLEIYFYGRERIQNVIQKFGFQITNQNGNKFLIKSEHIKFYTKISEIPIADVYIFTVKSGDTESIAREIKEKISSDSIIISFQNGVSNKERIEKILTNRKILSGMVPFNVVNLGEGKFHSGTSGELCLEESNQSRVIATSFQNSGLSIKVTNNMKGILWGKLIFNLNNPINALAGVPLKEELSNPKYRKILALCMKEALSILSKSNITPKGSGSMIPSIAPYILSLPNFLFFKIASKMIRIDPSARSSMWEDLENKRKTEIDFLNGEIVLLGKTLGTSTPINTRIFELIKETESKRLGSPALSPEQILPEIF
ncbi:MAG: 2-dehydropantoate 2-reductase [Leptospiraceae bacterium]|nr:2-dehydropantoate 2-reductase [Leptospiraceae bacterium]